MAVRPFPGCRKYLSYAPDEFDAMVFSCGDAIPQFAQHANEPYNQDLMAVIAAFGQKGKIMIGHCAGAMLFDMAGVIDGKTIAVHPLAKSAIQKGKATDNISIRPKMKIVSGMSLKPPRWHIFLGTYYSLSRIKARKRDQKTSSGASCLAR